MTTRPGALVTSAVPDAAALSRWQIIVAPLVTGALVAAPWLDFSFFPVAWVAFVPLLWALGRATSRRESLRLGLLAGLATNVPAFYWLVYTIHVFGGFPYPLALFFYACLSLYSAMQFVLFAWGFQRLRFGPLGLFAPVLWVALEFLFPNLFPWRMANSQLEMPLLMQSGDLTGPYLLSFVMVWVSAGIALALSARRRFAPLAAALAAAAALIVYGLWRMPVVQAAIDAAPTVRVGLVQGNIGIHEKGNVSLFDVNLDHYRELSAPLQSQVDVLIWPESVAQWWTEVGTDQLPPKHNPYVGTSTYLIYGGLAYEYPEEGGEAQMYNSAFLIDGGGRVFGRYDKHVLIPFGEYIPGGSLIPKVYDLSPQTSHFTPGAELAPLQVPGLLRIAPLICYEDVPARIAREMTAGGAEALLTIFNDAWFGRSMAPYQHEAIALWRAIENRRYFVRVGNAGVTGVVDPFGRVLDRLGMFTAETLRTDIRPLRITTVYTRIGDTFAWGIVAVAAASLLLARWKAR
ncbi:MAG TPA: apolipoprotein N-acyltransferase [Candidatus Dormibacteraeota bacterium]|nr:apolipoprotein N-acyltransferase [Candidatus Dormibacteraeota bacterium]